MMMKSSLFLLPLALILVVVLSSGAAKAERKVEAPRKMVGLAGGWKPIKNASDTHVADIGKFAVSTHNMRNDDYLVFLRVVKGESQAVDGVSYRLVLETKDDSPSLEKYKYEAVVLVKEREKFMQLISFDLLF